MEKYNSCSKPPTSQKIEVNPKLVVSKSHPYVLDVLRNLAITDWRWQSANVHLKSWQRDVREYKNSHLLWEKIWSSYGDSSECGHFLRYIQNLLGSNPQKFPAVSRWWKKETSPPNRLGHRLSDTECSGLSWKWKPFSWQRLWKGHWVKKSTVELTFCCPCVSWKKSLGHTRHRQTLILEERKHQISRENPTPTWRPRASASSQDWWPISGAFPSPRVPWFRLP